MQTIPIPPCAHVTEFMENEHTHLVLAHIFQQYPQYAKHYSELAHIRAKVPPYIILDNGAYELGKSISPTDLYHIAKKVRANEVAMPDALRDREATLIATESGLRAFQALLHEDNMIGPNIMLIPQGRTVAEWAYCLFKMVDLYVNRYRFTQEFYRSALVIGVPKWLQELPGGRYDMIANYVHPVVSDLCGTVIHVPVHVHCLGWETDMFSVGRLVRDFPWIRSIDSAKPFRFAAANKLLDWTLCQPDYRHGSDYFNWELNPIQLAFAKDNLQTYRMIAKGISRDSVQIEAIYATD